MYIFSTILGGIALGVFVTYYSRFINWVFKSASSSWDDDEICYSKHPMSESESESEPELESDSESEPESESESESESEPSVTYKHNEHVVEKNIPCYMKDFYEETTLTKEWLSKSEEEKKKILDRELEEYKNKSDKIINTLREIKC